MLLHTAIMCGFIVIQTVLFPAGLIRGAMPDVALIMLCFSANHHGSYRGELAGFASGFVYDALSLSPFGFHAAIRTIIGYVYGVFRGKIFFDPILVPVILVVVASVIRGLFAFVFAALFTPEMSRVIFSERFGIELGMNAALAPLLFALMKSLNMVRPGREQMGHE